MDEEIVIINTKTRNEKVKNFIIDNKRNIIILTLLIILFIFSYFIYEETKKRNKINIANKYNSITAIFLSGEKKETEKNLVDIVYEKEKTYSLLALFFLIDNNIIKEKNKINSLFDVVINEIKQEKEIKNLLIYKKALYNSDFTNENELIKILNPLINSDSIWNSHALHLMGEYFYFKGEKRKSKEFFEKILILEKSNLNIKRQAQKRINRDFSE
jgi:predicted negative regulator of RcsB-dependent stress response